MSSGPYVGQVGVLIKVRFLNSAGVAMSLVSATAKQIRLVSPSGVELLKPGAFVTDGADGWLGYETVAGVLDTPGIWEYYGYAEMVDGKIHITTPASFEVEQNLSNLLESITTSLNADWGSGTANSYISLTDANALVGTKILRHSLWTDATAQDKATALIEATTSIDALPFVGNRYYPNAQNLEWPRSFQYSWPYSLSIGANLYTIEQSRMLEAIRKATVYQAIWILQSNSAIFQEHLMNQAMGIKSYKEITGPIEDQVSYATAGGGNRGSANYHPQVFKLLNKWLTGPRVVRK